MSSNDRLRVFLAIEPPERVLKELADIQRRFRKSCTCHIGWTKPEGIHLTLKFFGDVAESDIAVIAGAAEKQAATLAPLRLDTKALGVFPTLKRPRVLWIGLQGDVGPLIVLQKNLEQGLAERGFPREEREFHPHLTLGRIKSSVRPGEWETLVNGASDLTAGSFCASGLVLFRSDLKPDGAVYTKLAQFPFGRQEIS